MASLPETSEFLEEVFQLEIDTPNKAGPTSYTITGSPVDGFMNVQGQQIANRTRWLKNKIEGFETSVSSNTNGEGASLVGIEDVGSFYTGTTVEAALQEVGSNSASLTTRVDTLEGRNWDVLATPVISAGALTIDLAAPSLFSVTLDQNVTSISFTNLPTGKAPVFAIVFTQDGTGGRTVTWPASVIGTPPDIGTDPGDVTVVSLAYIGGGQYVISGAIYA